MRPLNAVCLIAITLIALLPAAPSETNAATSDSLSLTTTQQQPNFIFIITDDQRWDALGCVQTEQGDKALFPWFKTPNMDRIAKEGARFRNAFVVHSLCSPSRASFLSGRPTHQHLVKHNQNPMPIDMQTWASQLSNSGYETAYFGKWHMGQQTERPGFEKVCSYLGQGKYNNCNFFRDGKKISSIGWVDDVTTNYAVDYLKQNHNKPFGMVIGYKSPHEPRRPPDRYEDAFANVELKKPVSHEVIPPFRPRGYKPLPWKSRIYDRLNYFRCLTAVDENVGRILNTLDEKNLTNDTVVVFVGDNGYYLGEHASHDKRTAYEESIRIPFLIRYPRKVKPGTVVDDITLNIDLAPTLMDLAGLNPLPDAVGKSLVQVLENPGAFKDRAMLYENYQDPEFPNVTFDIFALRTNRHKIVTYPGFPQWTEAFDLVADPLELYNVFDEPRFSAQRESLILQINKRLETAGIPLKPSKK